MIKLKKENKRAQEEEKKAEEDAKNGIVTEKKVKKSPAEIRLQGEVQELDIPSHAQCNFSPENLLNFSLKIDLK